MIVKKHTNGVKGGPGAVEEVQEVARKLEVAVVARHVGPVHAALRMQAGPATMHTHQFVRSHAIYINI